VGSGTATLKKEFQDLITPFNLPLKQKIGSPFKKKKIIVIAGPTGVGKTSTSLLVAEQLGGEIISADSMQVYKGMDIGTAKASVAERIKIPHHIIDIRTVHDTFNVMDFYREGQKAIHDILARGRVPIIVGGTGFYIHALIYGPPSGPPSQPEIRLRLETDMKELGAETLYAKLHLLDPDYAQTISQGDRHKIIRALEIITITNLKVSEFAPGPLEENEHYDFRCWFLHMPKEHLYPRLEMRCDKMIADGFLNEVQTLENEGLRANLTASQAIGYRQCLDYLNSAKTQEDWDNFVSTFKRAVKRYAKRQFTWFRKEPLFRWLDIEQMPPDAITTTLIQDYEQSQ
jgi:tRNA dimethylallyltransferase